MTARMGALAAIALLFSHACAAAAPSARALSGPAADEIRSGIASGNGVFHHSAWDALLSQHVDGRGGVDYAGLREERGKLDAYLAGLASAKLASLGRDQLLALFINAYNACTIRVVLDGAKDGSLPASIRDLPDPWGRKTCAVGGYRLSLDDIEHGIVRPLFKDARVHAALNCAARSCPPLAPRAYEGERVAAQLEDRMDAMVNSPAQVRVERKVLRVSKIMDWYGGDFVASDYADHAPTLVAYLLRHAGPELRRAIEAAGPNPRVDFLEYDWSLNRQ
jgi:hypothetical protein